MTVLRYIIDYLDILVFVFSLFGAIFGPLFALVALIGGFGSGSLAERLIWFLPAAGIAIFSILYILNFLKRSDREENEKKIKEAQLSEEQFISYYRNTWTNWRKGGYNIVDFNELARKSHSEIESYSKKISGDIEKLKQIEKNFQALLSSHPSWFESPEFRDSVNTIRSNLKNPEKVVDVEREFVTLKNRIFELEQISQQMEKLKT